MQLFHSPTSPFVRKVMVVLHETGQLPAVELLPASGHPLASQNMPTAHNPLGKVPTLLRDDGPAIYDSRVICRYLDDRFGAGLYPQARVWETLTLEATADAMMEAAVLMVYEHRVRPPEKVFDGWIDAQWAKVARCVEAVNGRWMSHLNGRLDMSHVAIGCALGYLDFRHPDRNWREGAGALDDWYAVFSARESMKATAPE